jgi:peptidoglycan/LPS O-acetylase OafA/YrhL
MTTIKELGVCVLFVRNFWGPMGIAGHFWSLSIEEQFYLIWPAVLLFSGRRRAMWMSATWALIFGALRWSVWSHEQSSRATWFYASALLIGCFFALAFADDRMRKVLAPAAKICIAPALAAYAVCVLVGPDGRASLLENALVGACIFSTFHRPNSLTARALGFMPLVWLGRISYSIYIWQELFMGARSLLLFCTVMPAVIAFSFFCIETPLNRVGHRLAKRFAASHAGEIDRAESITLERPIPIAG